MTAPVLYTLTSSLHTGMAPDPRQEPFIQSIEAALGVAFDCRGEDLQPYGSGGTELIYVRTGGTEGAFLKQLGGRSFRKPVLLLTSGRSNSLAASMEILSWLRAHGFEGEILHGSEPDIAGRIRSLSDGQPGVSQETDPTVPFPWGTLLAGKRYGVIGQPSDWLISSGVDYAAVRERLGAQLLDIPIGELVEEVRRGGAEQPGPGGADAGRLRKITDLRLPACRYMVCPGVRGEPVLCVFGRLVFGDGERGKALDAAGFCCEG